MAQFVAFKLIPVFAVLWIAGGGFIVAIEIISFIRAFIAGKAIRSEVNAALGTIGIVLLILGLVFRAISEQQERGPQLVLLLFGAVSLLGGIVTVLFLWQGLRQRT
jgi:hypothetical protein